MKRSLLLINYRSASLAIDAIRTARASSSQPLQVVAVDNSTDASEARALGPVADVVITAPRNLGYAGGINAGRRACDGDVIIVTNPDVRFGGNAIDALVDADAAVAGPALFWDEGYAWRLPPAELHTARQVASRALASRSRAWAFARDRRRFFARVAFWSLAVPSRVHTLSGAVLAIKAKAFDDAQGFDERFQLYFEENDFLRRVAGDIVYVPAARCHHLYNQSAGESPESAALYAQSESQYLRKWGGEFAKRFERKVPPIAVERLHEHGPRTFDGDVVLEASPLPTFETAAGHFEKGSISDVPDDVWRAYRGNVLYLRAVDRRSGRVLESWAKARIPA
ncbi:MAG TPA: glycosyltransferase [Thermoanaerobaculia bacterium]|nr:glycosyltransferase [Thermoanaerobaculia bacterium]